MLAVRLVCVSMFGLGHGRSLVTVPTLLMLLQSDCAAITARPVCSVRQPCCAHVPPQPGVSCAPVLCYAVRSRLCPVVTSFVTAWFCGLVGGPCCRAGILGMGFSGLSTVTSPPMFQQAVAQVTRGTAYPSPRFSQWASGPCLPECASPRSCASTVCLSPWSRPPECVPAAAVQLLPGTGHAEGPRVHPHRGRVRPFPGVSRGPRDVLPRTAPEPPHELLVRRLGRDRTDGRGRGGGGVK
jgi:hypothetical protein